MLLKARYGFKYTLEKGVEVTISKSKNEDLINMSDEDNEQLDYQVNDLLSQTFDQDDSLEDLFEQRQQQKESNHSQNEMTINSKIHVLLLLNLVI